MPYYFAYGSNMLAQQMAQRCPGARAVGPARLNGWRFMITKRGTANIKRDAKAEVHGVLWDCQPHHLSLLDQWEGVAWRNYLRQRVVVRLGCHAPEEVADGACDAAAAPAEFCHSFVYVSSRILAGRGRPDYLLNAVLPGARAFGLPDHFIAELESWLPRRPIAHSRRYMGRRRRS